MGKSFAVSQQPERQFMYLISWGNHLLYLSSKRDSFLLAAGASSYRVIASYISAAIVDIFLYLRSLTIFCCILAVGGIVCCILAAGGTACCILAVRGTGCLKRKYQRRRKNSHFLQKFHWEKLLTFACSRGKLLLMVKIWEENCYIYYKHKGTKVNYFLQIYLKGSKLETCLT